jgi:hypothetical protein
LADVYKLRRARHQADRVDLTDATCAFTSLTESLETYELLTRIYPRGAGMARALS